MAGSQTLRNRRTGGLVTLQNGLVINNTQELLKLCKGGVLILAGLPGSGKSKLAKELSKIHNNTLVLSSDDYFMRSGEYKFDPAKLGAAHDRCWRDYTGMCDRAGTWMYSGGLVIVDNTNTSPFELAPYVRYATGLRIPVLTLFVSRAFELCVRDQIHGAPLETMQRMSRNLTNTLNDFPSYWNHRIWRQQWLESSRPSSTP